MYGEGGSVVGTVDMGDMGDVVDLVDMRMKGPTQVCAQFISNF